MFLPSTISIYSGWENFDLSLDIGWVVALFGIIKFQGWHNFQLLWSQIKIFFCSFWVENFEILSWKGFWHADIGIVFSHLLLFLHFTGFSQLRHRCSAFWQHQQKQLLRVPLYHALAFSTPINQKQAKLYSYSKPQEKTASLAHKNTMLSRLFGFVSKKRKSRKITLNMQIRSKYTIRNNGKYLSK